MPRRVFEKLSDAPSEAIRYLRVESTGGVILLIATVLALVLANSAASEWYLALGNTVVGPAALNLDLTVAEWAMDGLLTIFFLVVALELKRELAIGELSSVGKALLPVFAGVGGMIGPAIVAYLIAFGEPGGQVVWAVPVATDIAFVMAALAICAPSLPTSIRVFLLSLLIVDDLGAILLIAILFTSGLTWWAMGAAAACLALYYVLQIKRVRYIAVYVLLGVVIWIAIHESGIHATIAGVFIAFVTRVKAAPGEKYPPAISLEHAMQPVSSGVCMPVFAFFAAGIPLNTAAFGNLFTERLALAVMLGLFFGKLAGITGGTALAVGIRLSKLPKNMGWSDVVGIATLGGCGFTLSMLIAELAFPDDAQQTTVKLAILVGSGLSLLVAILVLRFRVRAHSEPLPRLG